MTWFTGRSYTDPLWWHAYQLRWCTYWRKHDRRCLKLIQWRFVKVRAARTWSYLQAEQADSWDDLRSVRSHEARDRLHHAQARIDEIDHILFEEKQRDADRKRALDRAQAVPRQDPGAGRAGPAPRRGGPPLLAAAQRSERGLPAARASLRPQDRRR